MFSSALAAALAWRQVHYGWVVVGTTFLTMLIVAGAVGAPGVLLLPLQREFGWATSDISVAMALRLLLFGLMGPFAAALLNRFGIRRKWVSLSFPQFGEIGGNAGFDDGVVGGRSDGHRLLDKAVEQEATGL